MSATLHPVEYFSSSLGLHENAKVLNLPNPFPAENRFIGVIPTVSTRYQLRKQFHRPIAEIIDRIFEIHPGSYLCFFSSFEQLSAVHTHLNSPCLAQKPNMNEIEREGFLARISDGSGKLGLAVLGGIFAEGIDLPGSLDGVIVVGPGLPLYCPETEFQRAYYDEIYGDGFLYAYAYPGMNRVVQAAGRLIRNETDRGLIILLDARFNREPYRSLLPCDWYIEHPSELVIKDLEAELTRFWVSL
jgi:DNA excision repair protein ERCC-2